MHQPLTGITRIELQITVLSGKSLMIAIHGHRLVIGAIIKLYIY